jgi:hypothetical protein
MNYVVRNQSQKWEALRLYTFQSFQDGTYQRSAVLETDPSVRFDLADHPLPDGILRIDRLRSDKALDLRLGHYAIPHLQGPVKVTRHERAGQKAIIIDNGTYQLAMVTLAGWESLEVVAAKGLHPEADESSVINALVRTPEKPSHLLATLLLWKRSGAPWPEDALFPVEAATERADGSCAIIWKNGTTTLVKFP